jgi:hypothetical protein
MAYELTVFESYVVAAIIAFIVSLDVTGLLISQNTEFKGELGVRWVWKALTHSFLHATFHSALFYFYFVGLDLIPRWLIVEITTFFKNLGISFDGASARSALLFLFSTIVVIFVWITYSNKIIENHAKKVERDNNYMSDARIDVRLIYFLLSLVPFVAGKSIAFLQKIFNKEILQPPTVWPTWLIQTCLCLAVAVDMLAVTSFIRVWFRDAPDPGNETATGGNELMHFNFDHSTFSDHLIFAMVIFIGVLLISFIAIYLSGGLDEVRAKRALKFIRRLEPWMVFSFLLIALDHLFGNTLKSIAEFWIKAAVGIAFGFGMMRLLILFHGKGKVDEMVDEGYNVLSIHNLRSTNPFRDTHLGKDLFNFVIWVTIALTLLVIATFASFGGDVSSLNPLANLLFWTGAFANVGCLFLLFLPAKWLIAKKASDFESRMDAWIASAIQDKKRFFKRSKYISAVCLIIMFYMHLSFSNFFETWSFEGFFSLQDREMFLLPLAFSAFSYWIVFVLVWRRSARGENFASLRIERGQSKLCPNFGDALTALSLVVFSVGVCMVLIEKFA